MILNEILNITIYYKINMDVESYKQYKPVLCKFNCVHYIYLFQSIILYI